MKPHKQLSFFFAIIGVIIIITLIFTQIASKLSPEFNTKINPPTETPPPIIQHSVPSEGNFKQLWMVDRVQEKVDTNLNAVEGKVCFLGSFRTEDLSNEIFCLDEKDGHLLLDIDAGTIEDLVMSKTGIYIITSNYESYLLKKIDPTSGELIWRSQIGRKAFHLNIVDDQIQVLTYAGALWIFDFDGKLIRKINEPILPGLGSTGPIISLPDLTFYNSGNLEAYDTQHGNLVWSSNDGGSWGLPTIAVDTVVFSNNYSRNYGTFFGFDRKSGILLWKVKDITSNAVYSPAKHVFYMLRMDGALLAVDERSGNQQVIVQFSGDTTFHGGIVYGYKLAFDKGSHILFASLGDSHQLFAIEEP
jgi:outer membrane protein assembly factor BamB